LHRQFPAQRCRSCNAPRTAAHSRGRLQVCTYLIVRWRGAITFRMSSALLLSTPGQHPNAVLSTSGSV
jgi:hypothetical protein